MKLRRLFSIFLILMCCFAITPFAPAEESSNSDSSNGFFQGFKDILQESLKENLQEGIDDFIGNYKGSLGDVRLIKRVGNRIVLEVTYDNIKRSDNVHVQAEVLDFGTPLEGFTNTLNTVSGSRGKVKLAIGWSQKEDDGWGTISSEVKSDQIRLFLVRESDPDRPFGEIIYDISKTWINSNEPDEKSIIAESDGIELEDGELTPGNKPDNKPKPDIFVKPGSILKPEAQLATQPVTARTTTPTTTLPITPATITKVRQRAHEVNSYNFYKNAKSAVWRSSAGALSFPGSGNDKKGFARQIPTGRLNSGNAANSMLQTHPQWKSNGWIEGRFPLMILGDNLRFKSIVGFLRGANNTDGVTFQVYVRENNKSHKVASHRVSSKKYTAINADLSRWSGKKVQIVLRVRAGKTSAQDWAVWVKPRLSK